MNYTPHTAPWGAFQQEQLDQHSHKLVHAYLNEQGLGKSWNLIQDLCLAYLLRRINAILVVAPNGVHTNWAVKELPKHMHADIVSVIFEYHSKTANTKTQEALRKQFLATPTGKCPILCMSYDAVMTDKGKDFMKSFMKKYDVGYVLDESHFVKTPKAKRTKRVVASGNGAVMRRISTGTIMGANNCLDLYSQILFLDPDFWVKHLSIKNFGLFKSYFSDWVTTEKGWPKLIRYKNQDRLNELLKLISCRYLKKDVLKDLPDKIHTRIYIELPPEHRRVYKQMKEQLMAELLSGDQLEVMSTIVALGKLMQITSGYIKNTETKETIAIDGEFPRDKAAMEWCDSSDTQGIIWCRNTPDIDRMCALLGSRAVRLDGQVKQALREAELEQFAGGFAQFIVSNPQVGGTGYTWNEAERVLYHSVGTNIIELQQSQDRCHRIGQKKSVTYTYLVAHRTCDEKVLDTHLANKKIQSEILGDPKMEWM